jgi:Flp pilus assembly protein CpaB
MHHATKLISTKRGTIVVAAAAALLAGILILIYLSSYRSSVKAEGAPVRVLIAQQNIPRGTSGTVIASKGLFKTTTMRESQLLEGAFSDPTNLNGKVATQEIYKGAQLTAGAFSAGGKTLAAGLTGRERLVSVPLDTAHGLVGEIESGNHVDVYAGFNVVPLNADGTPVAGGQSRPVLRRIMSDIPVVDVGTNSGGVGSSSTTKVVLRATDVEAAKLAFASDNGKVWLALRPGAGAETSQLGIVSLETMLLGVPSINVLQALRGHR